MQLSIMTKPGLIGIQTTPAQLNIRTRPARLEIHQEVGRISINTRRPKLEINQYPSQAQLGYKRISDISAEMARLGAQKALEFVGNKTQEGNRLRALENGGNPIREIAIDKAWPVKQRQGGFTPIVGPAFSAVPGEVFITPPEVKNPVHIGYEAQFIPGELNSNYSPGKVDVYLRQYPEIKIDVGI